MTDPTRPDDPAADDPATVDSVVAVLERTLATYAGQAPPAVGLPDRVHRSRRRRTLVQAGVGAGGALVAAAIVVPMVLGGGSGSVDPAVQPPSAGWRWESHQGVEVQVPDDWGYGTTGQPWCLSDEALLAEPVPYVGRPGVVPMIACDQEVAPVEQRVPYVWFGGTAESQDLGDGWWLDSVDVGGDVQTVTVLTDDAAVRTHVLESIRTIDGTDANGCAVDHAVVADSEARPDPEPGLPRTGEATAAAICEYAVQDPLSSFMVESPLIASVALGAGEANELLGEIRAGQRPPLGVGDVDSMACYDDLGALAAVGSEVIVARIAGPDGVQDVYLWLGGCEDIRTDDGTTAPGSTTRRMWELLERGAITPAWESGDAAVGAFG